jgi:hypothetical protein
MVDKAMQDCFLLLHSIALSLSKKTHPEVDLDWLTSPPQSASEKPINRKSFFPW